MSRIFNRRKSGFTLIEINLVLLIVGIGLVSIMGLFPVGLREAESAAADTEQAMFAERVLCAIQAKAGLITDASVWDNEETFRNEVIKGLLDADTKISYGGGNDGNLITDYLTDKAFIRYVLDVSRVDSQNYMNFPGNSERFERLYQVSVWVSNRKNGKPKNNTPYTTYVFYKGVL